MPKHLSLLLIIALLVSCAPQTAPTASPTPPPVSSPTAASKVEETSPQSTSTGVEALANTPTPQNTTAPSPTPDYTPTPDTRLTPNLWRFWPIVPEQISARSRQIYQQGIANGTNPQAFTVVGDCQSQPAVFFGIYGTQDSYYLGEGFEYLQLTIDYFSGSFDRQAITVVNGLSVASIFSPLWVTDSRCLSSESPLECEIRLNNPSIVIISLGTNWQPNSEDAFEGHFRRLLDFAIERGVLPIIATKADNIEADNQLNVVMAQLAYEYDIPLWNFWLAVQHLPDHGIDSGHGDGLLYLTPSAWDIKSFTGLQALDAIWNAVK